MKINRIEENVSTNVVLNMRSFTSGRQLAILAGSIVCFGLLAGCASANENATPATESSSTTEAPEAATTTEASVSETETETETTEAVEVEEVEEAPQIPPSETFGSGSVLDAPTAEADTVVDVKVVDGEVQLDERRVKVATGSTVGIIIETDIVEHLHLHGYDILVDIAPGETANFSFLADQAGVFEVELEDSGRFLFEVQVS